MKKIIAVVLTVALLFMVTPITVSAEVTKEPEQPNRNATSVPILTFHRVVEDQVKDKHFPDNNVVARLSDFEEQIKWLHSNGYKTVSMDQFYDWYMGKSSIPENGVMLTCDDGYYETYHLMYPVLKKYGFGLTCFVIGSYTPEKTAEYDGTPTSYKIGSDVIEKMKTEYPKLDFQNHSYNLHYTENDEYAVDLKTREEIKDDIEKNSKFNFKYYAYPYGATNDVIKEELKNSGYKLAFGYKKRGYATRRDDRFEIRRLKVDGKITMKDFVAMMDRDTTKFNPDNDVNKITPNALAADMAKVNAKLLPQVDVAGVTTTGDVAKKTMTIGWKKVKNGTNYRVWYRETGDEKWMAAWSKGRTKFKMTKLKADGMYELKISPYTKKGEIWVKGKDSKIIYGYLQTVAGLKVKARAKGKAVVTWKKKKGASGYEVLYSLKKNMSKAKKVTTKGVKKTKATISKLKKGKKYFIKVRPYKMYKGKKYIGVMSKLKTVKAK